MEISCHLNSKQVLIFPTRKSMQRTSKTNNMISCRANTLQRERVSRNLYEVLSLESDKVSFDEIKAAYRNMARRYHPDVVPVSRKEESTKMFVELQQAYETLSDPILRQRYDYELGMRYLPGSRVKGMRSEEWRTNFYTEVWENQLRGLEIRSRDRKGRKRRS